MMAIPFRLNAFSVPSVNILEVIQIAYYIPMLGTFYIERCFDMDTERMNSQITIHKVSS